MEKKLRTQINFDIDPGLRNRIKIVAIKRNISMNLWLIRAIYIALRKEDDGCTSPSSNERNEPL